MACDIKKNSQTQERTIFSPNTLSPLMGDLYATAGFDEATSHSGLRRFITKLARSDITARVNMLRRNGVDYIAAFAGPA